jgi:hypothetical protein
MSALSALVGLSSLKLLAEKFGHNSGWLPDNLCRPDHTFLVVKDDLVDWLLYELRCQRIRLSFEALGLKCLKIGIQSRKGRHLQSIRFL